MLGKGKLLLLGRGCRSCSSRPLVPKEEGEERTKSHQFQRAREGDFRQEAPRHENSWSSDWVLQSFLNRHLPKEVLEETVLFQTAAQVLAGVAGDLQRWGERCATEVWALGRQCEENPPYLQQTDAWGHRVDRCRSCLCSSFSIQAGDLPCLETAEGHRGRGRAGGHPLPCRAGGA